MMKRLIVLSMAVFGLESFAASGIWGSFVQLTANGGSPQWYDVGYSSALPNLQGANLGTFDTTLGNTLVLSGGEVDIYKDGPDDVTGANVSWRVWSGTEGGSFSTIALGWTSNEPFNNAAGDAAGVGGSLDQKWAQIASTPNVLQGLTPGTYTLEIYLDAPFNFGTHYSNNGGANYEATFTVVPEPSTYALAAVGLVAIGIRRRMTKRA